MQAFIVEITTTVCVMILNLNKVLVDFRNQFECLINLLSSLKDIVTNAGNS